MQIKKKGDIPTKATAIALLIEVITVEKKKLNWPGSRDFVLPTSQSHSEIREEEEEVAGAEDRKEKTVSGRINKQTNKNRTKQNKTKKTEGYQRKTGRLERTLL